MMTVKQVKAARALLGWTQGNLATKSNLGTATIADYERAARQPHPETIKVIEATFARAGVQFIKGGVCANDSNNG